MTESHFGHCWIMLLLLVLFVAKSGTNSSLAVVDVPVDIRRRIAAVRTDRALLWKLRKRCLRLCCLHADLLVKEPAEPQVDRAPRLPSFLDIGHEGLLEDLDDQPHPLYSEESAGSGERKREIASFVKKMQTEKREHHAGKR